MAFSKKIQNPTPPIQMSTSQDAGNTFKLILITTIILLVIPPSSSRPMLFKKCPPTSKLDAGFLHQFSDETQLDLSSCRIQFIIPGSFDNMIHLKNLSLAKNNLKVLWPGIFRRSKALSTIDLSNNHLKFFPNTSFLKSKSVKQLIMRNNGIKHISRTTLQDLPHLKRLDLSGNPVCPVMECDMKSAHLISQWLHFNKAPRTETDRVILESKYDRTLLINASLPGHVDFAMHEDLAPIFSAIVIIVGLSMSVCALVVICTPRENNARKSEGFQKVPAAPTVNLEEVLSADPIRGQGLKKEVSLKRKLQLLYLIMKHSAKCGIRPVKL